MATHILATKLFIPPPRPKVIRRPRLLERLDEGIHGKLTLIAAPAGFGKTTNILPRWAGALFAAGAVLPIVLAMLPHPLDRTFAVPMGVALVGLGYALWSDWHAPDAHALPATGGPQLHAGGARSWRRSLQDKATLAHVPLLPTTTRLRGSAMAMGRQPSCASPPDSATLGFLRRIESINRSTERKGQHEGNCLSHLWIT